MRCARSARTWCSCRKCRARTKTTARRSTTGPKRRTTNSWPTASGRSSPMAATWSIPRATTATRCCPSSPSSTTRTTTCRSPVRRSAACCIACCACRATRSDVHVICVHLGLAENHRQQQLDLLCQMVRGEVPDDAPLIVAGDFNDWRRRANRVLERESACARSSCTAYGESAKTFPARFPLLLAGPHLRAQRLGAPAGRAAAQALVAPVRPRAAGGGDPSVGDSPCNRRWIDGNDIALLENGEEFFPRVFDGIANATTRGDASRPSSCSRTRSACSCTRRWSRRRGAACRST